MHKAQEECTYAVVEEYKKALEFIEEVTEKADEVQERVLTEILSRNADVEYLRRHGLDGHTDKRTFKNTIPVITYEEIRPDVTRIANGDSSQLLCSQPISELVISSGTSGGQPKLIPTTEEEMGRWQFLCSLVMPVVSKYVPGLHKGKGLYFMFICAEIKTPGGLIARNGSTRFGKSYSNNAYFDPYDSYTSPIETFLCLDSYQSIYSQMLCGLCQHKQVLRVGGVFAVGFIRVFHFLEKHWKLLCDDIRTGTLNPQITDTSVRDAVMKVLKQPDPELAEFIEAQCGSESWQGIIPKLWPNTKYVDVIVTGTMSQYIPTLDYYSNGLPIVSTTYVSSECFCGVNLNPLCNPTEIAYTLIPSLAYFEFLPIYRNNKQKEEEELVDLADVQLGQEYELVVTTYAGLYRYRVGDVLRVAGFKNKAPQFNFVCRRNVILSIDYDKTDELELQTAVKKATAHLVPFDAQLTDYTSFADTSTIPGHYVLYWEITQTGSSTHPIPDSVFETCCLTVEESLTSIYRLARSSHKTVGPLEIKVVKGGTFDELAIASGASIDQYKTPRCVKFAPIVELLNSRVVSSYFSPAFPEWVPQDLVASLN
ncbi:OLC1v1019279C1 [Oldenlandia corymbosa var. corymbosa]|uniref:OLC1v1019279C1 n=1 Tax=Oldenlandia corymbosa var. corymbosa TaxID=529605 RepID=A0AAV1EDN9_OLDCO|nr:OLC1v1019279C1 [Oldenlandia corymbosa var. corymbosa]